MCSLFTGNVDFRGRVVCNPHTYVPWKGIPGDGTCGVEIKRRFNGASSVHHDETKSCYWKRFTLDNRWPQPVPPFTREEVDTFYKSCPRACLQFERLKILNAQPCGIRKYLALSNAIKGAGKIVTQDGAHNKLINHIATCSGLTLRGHPYVPQVLCSPGAKG